MTGSKAVSYTHLDVYKRQDYYLKGRKGRNLTETVRNFEAYLPDYFPLVHPSPLNFRWQASNPWFKADVVPVLQQKVADILA